MRLASLQDLYLEELHDLYDAEKQELKALPKMIEGLLIADVVACIGSIDFILGEVDR